MSNRITLFVNTSCKIISSVQQCFRINTLHPNEKNIYRQFNLYPDHLIVRTYSTFNYDRLRIRTNSEHLSKNLNLSKFRTDCYLRCNDFSNQVGNNKNGFKKLTLFQKFKFMWKNYWYVLVPVHVVTSVFWFGGFYYLAASGIDVVNLLQMIGVPDTLIETVKSSKAGNVAGNAVAAFALYKIATPARYTVTVGGTTIAINILRKRGMIQPAGNKEQIKILYDKQRDALKNLKETYQGKMQVTKDEILKAKDDLQKHYKDHKDEFQRSMVQSHHDMRELKKTMVESVQDSWYKALFLRFTKNIQNLVKIKKHEK